MKLLFLSCVVYNSNNTTYILAGNGKIKAKFPYQDLKIKIVIWGKTHITVCIQNIIYISIKTEQLLSGMGWGNFDPQGKCLEDIFDCHNWRGLVLLESKGLRPGRLLNILQYTTHSLWTKNYLAPNANCAQAEKHIIAWQNKRTAELGYHRTSETRVMLTV